VAGADLPATWEPAPLIPLVLPTSDACGWALSPFGENRNVRGAEEPERSEMLGPKLRALGVAGLKLGEGPWLTGGPDGLNEGRAGAAWNDLPALKDGGLEGIEGAERG
jgi:hypothetical protein